MNRGHCDHRGGLPRGVQATTAVLASPDGRAVGPAGSSPVPWGRRCVCGGGSNNRCGSLFRGTPERTTSAKSSTVTIILHAASTNSFMHVRETGERRGAVRDSHAPADGGRRYVHMTSKTLTWALRQVPSQVHAAKMPDGPTPPHLSFLLTYHTHTRTHQATSRVYVAEESDGPTTSRTPHPPSCPVLLSPRGFLGSFLQLPLSITPHHAVEAVKSARPISLPLYGPFVLYLPPLGRPIDQLDFQSPTP